MKTPFAIGLIMVVLAANNTVAAAIDRAGMILPYLIVFIAVVVWLARGAVRAQGGE